MISEAVKEEITKKLMGLIESLSRMYLNKFPYSYFGIDDFIGLGEEALARCFNKFSGDSKEELEKYCKSSIYYAYQDSMVKIYTQKRAYIKEVKKEDGETEEIYATEITIDNTDSFLQLSTDGGFAEVEYTELLDHALTFFKHPLERKIFSIITNPPEELCRMAIYDNRRKMKATLSGKKMQNKVRLSPGLILEYLNSNGDTVSENAYYNHYKNVRDKVKQIILQ